MDQQKWLGPVIVLVLVVLILVGCDRQAPALPELTGRLIIHSGDRKYYQVALKGKNLTTEDVSGESFTLPVSVVPGAWGRFSPGGRFDAWADGDGSWSIERRDNGSRVPILAQDSGTALARDGFDTECEARWSPDARWVAVLDSGGLYIAGTDGQARLALQRHREWYKALEPTGYVYKDQATLATQISCPTWLGPDALLVDHFRGPLPEEFTGTKGIPGPYRHETTDTTSVLRVSEIDIKTVDLPARWTVVIISSDYTQAVLKLPRMVLNTWDYYLADMTYLLTGQGRQPQLLEDCSGDIAVSGRGKQPRCSDFSFSQDNNQVAFLSRKPENVVAIQVQDVASRSILKDIQLEEGQEPRSDLYWSPDGSAIAYTRGWKEPDVYVVLVDEGRTVPLPIKYTFEFSADLLGWIE